MSPLKQQISLIPFSIEHWYSPYKRRRFENWSDQTFCIWLGLIKYALSVSLHSVTRHIIMPPPRRGEGIKRWSASVVRLSVRLSVCLMSRTSALTRKSKGLRRRNFAQGYPRSHATATPTSRSKGQKSRSRGQLVQRSEMCQYFANG